MSSEKSGSGAPLENIALDPSERIQRWLTEVHHESESYHDYHAPFKSIEDSDEYGASPPQKVPPEQLLSGRPIQTDISDDSEGLQSISDPSDHENPAHDERRQPESQNVQSYKRAFQEPHDEQLSSKRRRLESSSLGDGLPNRALCARHPGDLSHSLKDSSPRALQVLENTPYYYDIGPNADDDVKQVLSHASAKLQKSYERQPRRKTRADKYEPKVMKRTSKPHRAKEAKRSKRTHSALKHDFKAPNVPQHRLTLKSGQYLGIFAKGKASSPVRRRGLPDLSFPEMNFLASRKDRHVEPVFPGAVRQLSKKEPSRTEQDKIAKCFSRPLMHQDPSKKGKSEAHRSLRGSSNGSPQKPTTNSNIAAETTGLLSKIGSISPDKSGRSEGLSASVVLSNQENAAPRPLHRSVRQGPTEHAEEDALDRSTLYFPWSTSNVPSQTPPRQPLRDVSKKYLTLEDLQQLLKKRRQEDLEDEVEASRGLNSGNEVEQTGFGTTSLFRSMEYQSMPSRYRQIAPPDTAQLPLRQGRVLNYGTPVTRRLPEMYTGQLAEPEDFKIFEVSSPSEERVDHRRFVSEGLRQYGTRNENVHTVPAIYAETSSGSPFQLWKDSQAEVEENEEDTCLFKPLNAKGSTRYGGSPQKTVTFVHGRDHEPQQHYGEPYERGARGEAHDVGVSALLLTKQEVNAELTSKGFWRPRRM